MEKAIDLFAFFAIALIVACVFGLVSWHWYERGYKEGQLDAHNNKWAYGMVTNANGETTWKAVPHAK